MKSLRLYFAASAWITCVKTRHSYPPWLASSSTESIPPSPPPSAASPRSNAACPRISWT